MPTADCTAAIDSSVELLRTIAAVLDIRDVFPQVSEIANKVLAHDLLTMMFHDRGGQILIEAASTDEFKGLTRFIKADDSQPDEGFVIIDDFTTATLPIVEPVDLRERIVAAGFRSLLVVLTRARHQDMGLAFWSPGGSRITWRWPCRTSSWPRRRVRLPTRRRVPSGSRRACNR